MTGALDSGMVLVSREDLRAVIRLARMSRHLAEDSATDRLADAAGICTNCGYDAFDLMADSVDPLHLLCCSCGTPKDVCPHCGHPACICVPGVDCGPSRTAKEHRHERD